MQTNLLLCLTRAYYLVGNISCLDLKLRAIKMHLNKDTFGRSLFTYELVVSNTEKMQNN